MMVLSGVGHLNKIDKLFREILIAKAVINGF
jgi:hypothetical protein